MSATQTAEIIRGSEIKGRGRLGTFTSKLGGIGLGYRVGRTVYASGGNGFYYPREVESFAADDGAGYRARLAELALPPAYRM